MAYFLCFKRKKTRTIQRSTGSVIRQLFISLVANSQFPGKSLVLRGRFKVSRHFGATKLQVLERVSFGEKSVIWTSFNGSLRTECTRYEGESSKVLIT